MWNPPLSSPRWLTKSNHEMNQLQFQVLIHLSIIDFSFWEVLKAWSGLAEEAGGGEGGGKERKKERKKILAYSTGNRRKRLRFTEPSN